MWLECDKGRGHHAIRIKRILISMIIWAIWKSRNKNSINNQDVTPDVRDKGDTKEPHRRSNEEELERDGFHGKPEEIDPPTRTPKPMRG